MSLTILGASYGLKDVTHVVRQLQKSDSFTATADNATFGDTWPGTEKNLVVVFQFAGHHPQTMVVQENAPISITAAHAGTKGTHPHTHGLTILGAGYGLGNVTDKVKGLVVHGKLAIAAENTVLGDEWPGKRKSLTVVYHVDGKSMVAIAEENQPLHVHHGSA